MLKQVPTPRSTFLSFSFDGMINRKDRSHLIKIIEKEIKKSSSVRLYLEFKIGRWEAMEDLWNELQVHLSYLKRIEKIAIAVTGQVQFHLEKSLDAADQINFRIYKTSQRSEAYNWLK